MNISPFCRDCLDLDQCQEVEPDDNDTEVLACDYKRL